jgi:hypothetical protein
MDSNSFHRLAKVLVDSGETSTIAEALDVFSRYGVKIHLGRSVERDVGQQIVALTAINCAARCFQGNVQIEGGDFELATPGFQGLRLQTFAEWAGVRPNYPYACNKWPRIVIGAEAVDRADLIAWSSGWNCGLGAAPAAGEVFAPACVAAAGIAVSEAFSLLRVDNPYSGRRSVRMSLWNPNSPESESRASGLIPPQDALWLVGLGHLGQAYAWTLGFISPGSRPVVLQDIDDVTHSTMSTSMVSHVSDVGCKKTRVVARWLESRGYQTALVERRFDENQRIRPEEPATALFGVDNAAARRVVERAGFSLVIDGGLGAGFSNFRGIRVRTFPGPSRADALWSSEPSPALPLTAPYLRLIREGADACGVTTLATRAVGAPFVGCVAAAFVVAERIRRQLEGPSFGFLDLNLREPERAEAG